jgi:hypothetical protein
VQTLDHNFSLFSFYSLPTIRYSPMGGDFDFLNGRRTLAVFKGAGFPSASDFDFELSTLNSFRPNLGLWRGSRKKTVASSPPSTPEYAQFGKLVSSCGSA